MTAKPFCLRWPVNDKRLAMAGAVLLVGAAVLLWSRRSVAAADASSMADVGSLPTIDGIAGALGSLFTGVESAGYVVTDTVESVVNTATGQGWQPPARAAAYLPALDAAERANNIPHYLLARLAYQESRFREDIITGATSSPAGALGIMQFMPATARDFGIDPLDPFQAIPAAGRYLAQLYKRFGNWPEALAAYNWGQGNVSRSGLASAPLETRNYVAQITADVPVA